MHSHLDTMVNIIFHWLRFCSIWIAQFILHIFNRYLSTASELLYQIDESLPWSLRKSYGTIIQTHFIKMILQI